MNLKFVQKLIPLLGTFKQIQQHQIELFPGDSIIIGCSISLPVNNLSLEDGSLEYVKSLGGKQIWSL